MKNNNRKKIAYSALSVALVSLIYFTKQGSRRTAKENRRSIASKVRARGYTNTASLIEEESARAAALKPPKKDNQRKWDHRNIEVTKRIYKKLANYPSSTQPLKGDETNDPIKLKYSAQSASTIGEEKSSLRVNMDKTVYTEGERVELSIKSFFEGEQEASQILVTNNGVILKSLPTNDEGELTYTFSASGVGAGDHLLNVYAQVKGEAAEISLGYKVQPKEVELIEEFDSQISSDGNLVFNSKIRFLINGNYLIKGVLYDTNGLLIGQAKAHLAEVSGESDVRLEFYGKLINDSKLNGPYMLKCLEVIRVDSELTFVSQSFFEIESVTEAHEYSVFRNDAFEDQDLAQKISWLE